MVSSEHGVVLHLFIWVNTSSNGEDDPIPDDTPFTTIGTLFTTFGIFVDNVCVSVVATGSSFVVVIGTPNTNGQIEAKLVRILPDPVDIMGAPFGDAGIAPVNTVPLKK